LLSGVYPDMSWLLLLFAWMSPPSPVNAVIGDESYVARFGTAPDASVDEDVRIRVHLEHVEALLRAADTGHLTGAQRAERARHLDRLHAYHRAGVFPRNHSVPGRRPHFIDEDGRPCAVGYLIEQSAGRAAAEAINARHEWSYLPDIDGIDAWVAASGLSVRELAMIQPGYDWRPPPPPPPPDDREVLRQAIVDGLDDASEAIQACADRFDRWSTRETVRVAITVRFRAVRIGTRGIGGSMRRCVRRAVEQAVGGMFLQTPSAAPLTVFHAFSIVVRDDEDDFTFDDDDGRFARPPA
jgi:hypothetical protein